MEFQSAQDSFWQENNDHRTVVLKRIAEIKSLLEKWETILSHQNDTESAIELLEVEDDKDLKKEVVDLLSCNDVNIQSLELDRLLGGPQDKNNAILTINSGAGGTESMDWAEMLYRMYKRWAESYKYKVSVLDFQAGDEAGIKSMTMSIEGEYTYGKLKAEVGVHRLVRISPFDSSSRRHTSFASVDVAPEIDDEIEIDIQDKELRIDTYCSSGAGGQSVNTTYSAVRITHIPTNLVVTCQNERSQLSNKQTAMKILKSRLFQLELRKREEDAMKNQMEKMEIGWGSQIRSYVLHPYQMVKDHRTNFESSGSDKVLDGELEDFMFEYLKWSSSYSNRA